MGSADYSMGLFEINEAKETNFEEFTSIALGHSITSAADLGPDRFELGLSGNLLVRIFRTQTGMNINLVSTTNPGEITPISLALGNMPKRVTASILEKKLRGLRALYTISYLLTSDRVSDLESYLYVHPYGDIERALLKEDEQLYIESVSYGSWIVTVWNKRKEAYRALVAALAMAYARGRESLLRKLEAEARLKEAETKRQEVAVEQDTFTLAKDKMDYLFQLRERVSDPTVRENVDHRIIKAVRELTQGDIDDSDASRNLQKRLPPSRGL